MAHHWPCPVRKHGLPPYEPVWRSMKTRSHMGRVSNPMALCGVIALGHPGRRSFRNKQRAPLDSSYLCRIQRIGGCDTPQPLGEDRPKMNEIICLIDLLPLKHISISPQVVESSTSALINREEKHYQIMCRAHPKVRGLRLISDSLHLLVRETNYRVHRSIQIPYSSITLTSSSHPSSW